LRRYRWLILAAGTLSATSLAAVQTGISAILPELRDAYDLSLAQLGIVLAAANAGMVVTLLAWGIVTDRIGERLALTLGLAGAALSLVVAAETHTFGGLVASLAATGAFAASVNAAGGRAVMHWFDRDERGLALGIRQASVPLGGFAAALALPAIVSHRSVHAAFFALAANCVIWGALAAVVLRERELDEHVAEELRSPLRDARMWLLCGSSALVLAGQLAIMGYVVLFLHDARGLSTAHAAFVLAAVQVGGAAARIFVGRLSDRTGRRIPLFIRVSVLISVTLAVAAILVDAPLVVLIPILVVAGTFGMSWNGLSFTAAAEAAGARRSGAAIGFQQTALAIGSLVVPIWFAALVSSASWRVAFLAAAGCSLAGALLLRRLSDL
jgi:sugar phosphate permease